jgi:hypothetical protein
MDDNLRFTGAATGSDAAAMNDMEALKQKIKADEISLRVAESNNSVSWITLAVSFGIAFFIALKTLRYGSLYWLITAFAFLYFGFNVWRLVRAFNRKKEIESELQQDRDRLAELQGTSPGRE